MGVQTFFSTATMGHKNILKNKYYGTETEHVLTNNQPFIIGALMTSQKIDLKESLYLTLLGRVEVEEI